MKNISNKLKNENGTVKSIPQKSVYKLKIPKPNTLTDQFMKTILGS